jgi:hypothetical protein
VQRRELLLGIRVGELEGSSLGAVGGFEIIKWKDMKLLVLKLMKFEFLS